MILLIFGVTCVQAASTTVVVDTGGQSITYELALDEMFVSQSAASGAVQRVEGVSSVEALELHANAIFAQGNKYWPVVYPVGARTDGNRRYLTQEILVKLGENVLPSAVSTAFPVSYRGIIGVTDKYHQFVCANAFASLHLVSQIRGMQGVEMANLVLGSSMELEHVPNDPLFANQWHLLNTGAQGGLLGVDVNVTDVWDRFRGTNMHILIIDSGIEYTHEDLAGNYNTNIDFDPLEGDDDAFPNPVASGLHGTSVAGVSAAVGDNGVGVSGAAPAATLAGVPLIVGQPIPSTAFFQTFTHMNDTFHIYNNSWGPGTRGMDLAPLDLMASNAIVDSINFGRSGRGSIFVFTAGNNGGANVQGNANYRQTANLIYTIAVGALLNDGSRADYSSPGAAVTISAPSGNDFINSTNGTTTVDLTGINGLNNASASIPGAVDYTNQNYTAYFNGTSSAAPLVSGGLALILESNPNLGWRDVQEIVMRSATKVDTNDVDWATNSAGFHFNHKFGAGMLNVGAAVALATNWTNLTLHTNISVLDENLQAVIGDQAPVSQVLVVTQQNLRVEHAQLRVNAQHPLRGDLQIELVSPSGMTSVVSEVHGDFNQDIDWTFSSVRHWGEFAEGDWTVNIIDGRPGANGLLHDLELTLWGSISNRVFASLTNPPSVLNHPLSRTATKGSDVLFRVEAIGSGQLNYRWLFNGQELSGQNSSTLIVHDVSPLQQGTYRVRIDNQFGTVVSAGASLFVNSPPEVTAQPSGRMVNIGDNVMLNVAALGNSPLTYQWRFNGSPLASETGSTLTLNNFQAANAGNYDVIIRNPLSSIISDIAMISANTPVVFSGVTPSVGGSAFMFNFSGDTGMTFRVDGSIDLRIWSPLSTNTLSSGASSFSDGAASTFTNRYYRVVPLP